MFLLRFPYEFYFLYGFLYCSREVIEVYGLRGKVKGTIVHRRPDVAHVAVCRHHDALKGGISHLVEFGEKRKSVHFRHVYVAENYIEVFLLKHHLKSLKTIMGKREFIFPLAYFPSEILR